jgi:MFS family permease
MKRDESLNTNKNSGAVGKRIGRFFIPNIIILGLTSLLMDLSSEMVYPLIPLFLAGFGVTPAIIGLIEGIAESLAAFLRVFSGWIGDRTGREKQLTIAGYSASLIYKVLLFLSLSWIGVLIARVVDRVGKGIRTAPRDALVAASGGDMKLGRSFGLHKMMDMLGSALGVLLAFVIVHAGMSFQSAFLISMIPAALGIVVICFVVQGKRSPSMNIEATASAIPDAKIDFIQKGFKPSKKLIAYLGIIFVFCIGNSSNAFLLLKASDSGLSASAVILVYFLSNITASVFSYPMGRLSDRIGRRRLIVSGYLLYGITYFGFAFLNDSWQISVLFIFYGLYTALISGAERAFIVEQAPTDYKGTVLGLYGMSQGFGLLIASILAGELWNIIGSSAPFIFGGTIGIVCAVSIGVLMRSNKSFNLL